MPPRYLRQPDHEPAVPTIKDSAPTAQSPITQSHIVPMVQRAIENSTQQPLTPALTQVLRAAYGRDYVQRLIDQSSPRATSPSPMTQSLSDFLSGIQTARSERAARSSMPLQAKLTVTPAGDQYEQEADAVAHQVVQQINAPTVPHAAAVQTVQRQANEDDKDKLQMMRVRAVVQRQSGDTLGGLDVSSETESRIQMARGGGQPIPEGSRSKLEGAFGADFSGVRVHTDGESDALNRSVQARAFTTGQDIFFRQGEFSPSSTGGQELLAHELTHVVQQVGNTLHKKAQPVQSPNQAVVLAAQKIALARKMLMIQRAVNVYDKNAYADPITYIKGKKAGHAIVEDSGSEGLQSPAKEDLVRKLINQKGRRALLHEMQQKRAALVQQGNDNKARDVDPLIAALSALIKAAGSGKYEESLKKTIAFVRQNSMKLEEFNFIKPHKHVDDTIDSGQAPQTFHKDSGFVKADAQAIATVNAQGVQTAKALAALNGPFNKGWVRGHHGIANLTHRFIEHIHVNKNSTTPQTHPPIDIYNSDAADADKVAEASAWYRADGKDIQSYTQKLGSVLNDAYATDETRDEGALFTKINT